MKQLSTLLIFIFISIRVFGQQETKPKECTNPGNGILVGGGFSISPQFACLDFSSNSATIFASNSISPSGGQLSNVGYIFNFKDGDNPIFPAGNPTSTIVSKPGTYWIMQGGNDKGQAYVTCNSFEVIQTEQPDVDVRISCDRKIVSIKFLNTVRNQKHGKYRIIWGDGIQEIISRPSFPFEKTHSYLNPPPALPQIVAIYTRGESNGFDVCQSPPYQYSFDFIYKPIINKVQNLNDGKRAKISMEGGNDDKVYAIQQKISDKWLNTGYRISRKKGETSSEIEFEITQPSSENCFRLQAVDSLCNNGITSNEICKLSLETSYLSSKYVELKWNALDTTNLQRYIISYSELDGKNANTSASQKRANSFNFEIPDCSKKYNIEVIGEYIDRPNKMISVSQKVIIDPSISPNNNAAVSVLPIGGVRYNIFESSNLKEKYQFYRSTNGGELIKIEESTQNFYNDTNVDTEKNYYCYAYKHESYCGIISELSVNNPCTIKLSIENNELRWNVAIINNQSLIETNYFIEKVDTAGFFKDIDVLATNNPYSLEELIQLNVKKDSLKFKIHAVNKFTINVDGQIIYFPFDTYSNTVTYYPILSTSKEADSFKIYPNPSEEFVQLNSTLQLKNVEIVDLQGKVIENQTIENGQVSVKHLPKGKYILRLYGNDKKLISSKAIIKM